MNKLLLLILFALAVSCKSKSYKPTDHLTAKEQDAIMWTIIRYVGRAPEGLTYPERFYKGYDPHYREQQSLHRMDAFFIKGDTCYFLVSRRAPSLIEKRVATGGKLVLADGGTLAYYYEVFRTFKMKDEELKKKSMLLFDRMVKGESLTLFERKRSQEEYIEFPDEINYYDAQERQWKQRERPLP
jgi:hypothetical protein